jgi:hypothetical protein
MHSDNFHHNVAVILSRVKRKPGNTIERQDDGYETESRKLVKIAMYP